MSAGFGGRPADCEWRWRKRGPRKAGHLFNRTNQRPNSLCGQIWSGPFNDTDEDWHAPLSPRPGSKVCSKCEKQYQKLLFDGKKPTSDDLKLVGAPTPKPQSPPFALTEHQRAICIVEYEAQLVLQTAKLGAPTRANARAVLVAAGRMAAGLGVPLSEFLDAAKAEWKFAQKAKPAVETCK